MAATRLSEGQKSQIVARFREGESSQDLAAAFDCSAATITRVVKGVLSGEEYERLKAQRGRRSRASEEPATTPEAEPAPEAIAIPPDTRPEPVAAPEPEHSPPAPAVPENRREQDPDDDGLPDSGGVLAIDDADDFGDDDDDDFAEDDGADGESFMPIPVALALDDHTLHEARPLVGATLPASAYMLVDKTVELQARPLSELLELGRLPPGEEARQALVVYVNPRQAKRQCGRTQRVIKLPDPSLLERTAPYLLAQGISRVVIEGALYALPGS
ncbi:hypothetical protein NZK33_13140 [Cyanobium sp. FGCU-6]|jgi:hypothetical protein|nr:hypothetical protein [Cyanobium sp. FGCU6]